MFILIYLTATDLFGLLFDLCHGTSLQTAVKMSRISTFVKSLCELQRQKWRQFFLKSAAEMAVSDLLGRSMLFKKKKLIVVTTANPVLLSCDTIAVTLLGKVHCSHLHLICRKKPDLSSHLKEKEFFFFI